MVRGLDLFRAHFAGFSNKYVLIGGTACSIFLEEAGLTFRSTKDLDIVLCIEVLDPAFVRLFWEFIKKGNYEIQQKSTGAKQFYRFQKPQDESFPYMLELFSRLPDALHIEGDAHLTPIPVEEEVSSLSAILMNNDYYGFIQSGRLEHDGLSLVGPLGLIPLKARAFLDLRKRKAAGESIDRKDISKHKNDVLRLYQLIDLEGYTPLPDPIQADLSSFLEIIKAEGAVDLKALGIKGTTLEEIIKNLRFKFGLRP